MSRQTVLESIVTAWLIIPNGRADFSPVPQELELAEIIQKTRRHGRVCRLGALFEACLWREGERMRNANTFQNQVTNEDGIWDLKSLAARFLPKERKPSQDKAYRDGQLIQTSDAPGRQNP